MRLLRLIVASSLCRHSRSLAPQTKPAPAALDHSPQRRIAELREQRNAIDAELAALEDEHRRPITPKRQIKALRQPVCGHLRRAPGNYCARRALRLSRGARRGRDAYLMTS